MGRAPSPNPPVRVWRDWALVGLLAPIALLEGLLRPDLSWRVVSVAVTIGLIPTLLWRRSRPLPVVAIVFVTTSLALLLTGGDSAETYTMGYLLIVVYALVRWGSGREVVIGLTIMLVAVYLSIAFDRLAPADVVAAFAVMFSAVALGGAFRYRARARMRELDQVKLLEREQLARDLHDTVAHHVSAMAIRAQAGIATSASRPSAATEALHVIEAEASRALAEMRAMVRVLRRDQPANLAPGRRVTDLRQLADQGPSGPSVDVEISGDLDDLPFGRGGDLPPRPGGGHQRPAARSSRHPRRGPGHRRRHVGVPARERRRRHRFHPPARTAGVRAHRHGRTRRPARRHLRGGPGLRSRLDRHRRAAPVRGGGMSIRVLVADDQEIVRTGLAMILDAQPDIEVIGEAADGRRAVELARRLRPDVCLFDIRMPGIDGIQATRLLAGPAVDDPLAVVVITTFDLDEYVYAALRAGARGFLLKDAGTVLLSQAVHAAANGDALIAPSITARLLGAFAEAGPASPPLRPVEALTDREEQILVTVARGRTNSEIAGEFHISLSTVKSHIASLMAKLGARNRVEIAIWAYETRRVRS